MSVLDLIANWLAEHPDVRLVISAVLGFVFYLYYRTAFGFGDHRDTSHIDTAYKERTP